MIFFIFRKSGDFRYGMAEGLGDFRYMISCAGYSDCFSKTALVLSQSGGNAAPAC